jgi:hypothetical protein
MEVQKIIETKPEIALNDEDVTLVRSFLSNLHEYWDKMPDRLKNRFFRLVLQKIEVVHHPETNTIEAIVFWRTGDKYPVIIHYDSYWREPDWNENEEKLLSELWPQESSDNIRVAFPDRSWTSIKCKAIRMHIKRDSKKCHQVKYSSWQPGEEAILTHDYLNGQLNVRELAHLLGRTERSVSGKIDRMGMVKPQNRDSQKQKLQVKWANKESLPPIDAYQVGRKSDAALGAGNGDHPVFQRLAENFQQCMAEFRQFV